MVKFLSLLCYYLKLLILMKLGVSQCVLALKHMVKLYGPVLLLFC